jgi:hypothetical protein
VSENLPDDPETLKAMLLAERHESERLRQIIKELQRHRFGRKAETLWKCRAMAAELPDPKPGSRRARNTPEFRT